jgi:hypothetical protein
VQSAECVNCQRSPCSERLLTFNMMFVIASKLPLGTHSSQSLHPREDPLYKDQNIKCVKWRNRKGKYFWRAGYVIGSCNVHHCRCPEPSSVSFSFPIDFPFNRPITCNICALFFSTWRWRQHVLANLWYTRIKRRGSPRNHISPWKPQNHDSLISMKKMAFSELLYPVSSFVIFVLKIRFKELVLL